MNDEPYKRLSKKEINEIMTPISPLIYIGNKVYKEKFKQVILIKNNNECCLPFIVSSFGRIFSINYWGSGKVHRIKTAIVVDGYELANMRYKNVLYGVEVHRLIGLLFLKRGKKDTDVNHLNGIKTDNYIWNLEWCTHKENVRHAWDNNLHPVYRGEDVSTNKFSTAQIRHACELIEENLLSLKEIAEKTGVSKDIVKSLRVKKCWKHIVKDYDFSHYTPKHKKHK